MPEEAFICALLHNLGKIIVCLYLPDRYREIEEKIKAGMTQHEAARAVLDDLTFEEIGEEVAAFWNLSERVIAAMKTAPAQPRDMYDSLAYLQNLSSFSNQLVDYICEEKNLDGLMALYGNRLAINKEEALVVVNRSVEASEDIFDSIRYGLSKLKMRSRLRYAEDVVRNPERAKKRKLLEAEGGEEPEGEEPREEETVEVLDDLAIGPDKSINDFIHDITETLMGPFNINDFYINLLEGLYRGIGFDRVLLAIMSIQADKKVLVGRFGLGDIDPAGIANFEYNLNVPGVVAQALKNGKDMAVPPNTAGAFSENMKYLVKDRMVYLFPICLDGKPIGMIYLDRKKGRPKLDAAMVKATRLFAISR